MIKSVATKIALGIVGTGAVTAGVVYATLPDSYANYLNKQGRILITGTKDKWEGAKAKYASEGDELLITIDNKNIAKGSLTAEQLMNWCNKNSGKSFTNLDDPIYQRVSAWCTEPKTIAQFIGDKKTVLSDKEPTDNQVNADEEAWNSKKIAYNATTNTDLIKEISETTTTTEGTDIQNKALSETKKLRSWCKFSKGKHFKHEKDSRYLKYLKWCVK